jgi:hypothetical protein
MGEGEQQERATQVGVVELTEVVEGSMEVRGPSVLKN